MSLGKDSKSFDTNRAIILGIKQGLSPAVPFLGHGFKFCNLEKSDKNAI